MNWRRDRKKVIGWKESADERNLPQVAFSRQQKEVIRRKGYVCHGALGSTKDLRVRLEGLPNQEDLPGPCPVSGMLVKQSKELLHKIVLPCWWPSR